MGINTSYIPPVVLAVIMTGKAIPAQAPQSNPETIRIYHHAPSLVYPEDIRKFHKQQLADTFSFKRKGFRKFQK